MTLYLMTEPVDETLQEFMDLGQQIMGPNVSIWDDGLDPLVVLGHSYWKKRFNRDPSVVGRAVVVNGRPFTVAGVVPPSFEGVYALVEFDAYLPLSMQPHDDYHKLIR